MEYHRLGDHIREVNVRNRDLKVTNLLGLSIEKRFIPSIANTIGTDMSVYKIIKRNQFAYVPVTSRNGDKITIALLDEEEAIISQAYTVFEIVSVETGDNVETGGNVGTHGDVETHGRASLRTPILPEYLMIWFRRPEFDRYARFHSHGSAREVFDWDELCNVMLPIPTIDRQHEIVAEYETLSNRIRLNEQMIEKLEATAQALYRKMFVDGVDRENLPEGWRKGKFTEVVNICGGGTPSTEEAEYWESGEIPFYSPSDKTNFYYSLRTEKHITEKGLMHCSSKLYPENTTFVTARGATTGGLALTGCPMAMNQTCYALVDKEKKSPFYIHQLALETMASLKNEAVGATFEALVTKDFESTEIVIVPIELRNVFNEKAKVLYRNILLKQQENSKLTELQSLLLARMGRV